MRNFNPAVVGWVPEPLSRGDYRDYVIKEADSNTWISGLCRQRCETANLPAVAVAALHRGGRSRREPGPAACAERDGPQLSDIKGEAGGDRTVNIQDPAGAYIALGQRGRGDS